MKAISLIQPWATLILDGIKTIETRTWSTKYRGDLLICAGQKYSGDFTDDTQTILNRVFKAKNYTPKHQLAHAQGVALCVVNLIHVRDYGLTENDIYQGCYPFTEGRKAWIIDNVRPVKQVPVKGKLSLFEVDDSLIQYL